MNPHLLQKQIRDNASDLESFCKDLKGWKIDMEIKEKKNQGGDKEDVNKPKVRKLSASSLKQKKKSDGEKPKRIATVDYSTWDKFDVEAECAKLDKSSDESDLTDECDNTSIEMANVEKEKGNKYVKKTEWDKAIVRYTAAIKLYGYDPIFYANRALCHLKLNEFQACEEDCTKALKLDPTYVKAIHRRAMAREGLGLLSEAHEDLQSLLKLEPNNKETKNELTKLEKKLEEINTVKASNEEVQRPKSKFTISRQRKDQIAVEKKMETEAVRSHVTERPSNVNDIIGGIVERTPPPQPGTSKPSINSSLETSTVKTIWPSGENVELVETTYKQPNQRSKRKLKRIQVIDVDKTTINQSSDAKTNHNKQNSTQTNKSAIEVVTANVANTLFNIGKPSSTKVDDQEPDIRNLPPPKTAIQFCNKWKVLKNSTLRLQYLGKINPEGLSDIFKESLSSTLFSEIIAILAHDEERTLSAYHYLMGLTKVKRFGALTMFMSREDKKNLFTLVDFMRDDNTLEQAEVDSLIIKYEL